MATIEKKEKLFRVQLKPSFKIPQFKGQPKTGVLYIRGGFQFTDQYGEGQSYHIVKESELKKFMMSQNTVHAIDTPEYGLDPNLVIEEVK